MSMLPADAHRRLERPHQPIWPKVSIWPIRGIRVENDTVVIKALDNPSARHMCGLLVSLFEAQRRGK